MIPKIKCEFNTYTNAIVIMFEDSVDSEIAAYVNLLVDKWVVTNSGEVFSQEVESHLNYEVSRTMNVMVESGSIIYDNLRGLWRALDDLIKWEQDNG